MATVKCTTVLVQVVGVWVKRGGVWIKVHADPMGVLSMRVQGEWVGGLSHYALTGLGTQASVPNRHSLTVRPTSSGQNDSSATFLASVTKTVIRAEAVLKCTEVYTTLCTTDTPCALQCSTFESTSQSG